MSKYYLNKERFEELKKELNKLKTEKREEVADRLKKAKEYGDLSENSEYSEAREEQRVVEGRILELEEVLRKAVMIEKKEGGDKVEIGSTIIAEKDGKKFEFQMVGSNEAKPEEGKISNESPLGRAFLGKKVGEKITFNAPSGQITYRLVKIE